MEGVITFEFVMFFIAMSGVIFGIYKTFRNPTTRNKEKISALESSFNGFQVLNEKIQNLGDNHIHTVEKKVDALSENVISMGKELVRLTTIINERIPK